MAVKLNKNSIFYHCLLLSSSSVVLQLLGFGYRILLGRLAGAQAIAVYGLVMSSAYNVVLSCTLTGVALSVSRIASGYLALGQGRSIIRLIRTALTLFIGLFCLLAVPFGLNREFFASRVLGNPQTAPALLLIVPGLISLIQNLGVEIQRAVNKHRFMAIVYSVMAVGNVIISIPLAMWMGPVGSALGTAISLVLVNGLAMNIYYRKKIGLDIPSFWKSILSLMKGVIPPTILGAVIMKMVTFDHLIVYFGWILLYTVVYCASMWLLGMNADEKSLVKRILSKLKRKA